MRRLPTSSGYSIVEVMIFLAITGLIFVSAATAIGGQQRNVQYSQAVREFDSQVRDIINDVATGYFPENGRGICTLENGSVKIVSAVQPLESNNRGTSTECVFVGKALMFNIVGHEDSIGVGTLVGANVDSGSNNSLSISSLNPSLAYNPANNVDLTEYRSLRYGLRVTKIARVSDPLKTYDTLGFISGLNSQLGTRSFSNGTLATDMYAILGNVTPIPAKSLDDYSITIQSLADSSRAEKNPDQGIYICVQTTDNKRARIIIGSNNGSTSTSTEFELLAGDICP